MGYIGSKSGITKLSELENDVGYTGSKGTVKEFRVSSGKFSSVTLSTVYPTFNVPVTTSQITNDSGFGKGILKDIKRNKVRNPSQESDWESTLEPLNASTANIFVPTKTSQLSNNEGYTDKNGTITQIIAKVGERGSDGKLKPFSSFTVDSGSAEFNVPTHTSQLSNDTGIKTEAYFENLYQVHHITDRDNVFFTISDKFESPPDLYFIRFGNIRMIFTNSTVHIELTATGNHYVSDFLHIKDSKDYPKAPSLASGDDIICGIGCGGSNYYSEIGYVHGIIGIYNNSFYAYGFDHFNVNYVNLKFYAVWIANSV